MQRSDLERGEVVAAVGGVLLVVSLFLAWYSLGNSYASVASCRHPAGSCSGWDALGAVKFLLIVAALTPAVLIAAIVRREALPWPPGEITAVFALIALTLIVFRGIIDRPGWPSGEVGIGIGWFVALLGGLLILLGALTRMHASGRRRKPPGML